MQPITKTIQLTDNRTITIETGKLAKQADGSVVVRMGNAMLLATVVAKKESEEDIGFLPPLCRLSREVCRCRQDSWRISKTRRQARRP